MYTMLSRFSINEPDILYTAQLYSFLFHSRTKLNRMVYLSRNKQLTVPGLAAYLEEKLCFTFNLKSVYETKLRRIVIGNHPAIVCH